MEARFTDKSSGKSVVAICGGVGGAKLALGLYHLLGERLTVVVNVGDDFDHFGLRICPDLDTVIYTLGGLSDEVRGWGRAGESWNFMETMRQLGGEDWFLLGDKDLALHVERTRRIAAGERLTEAIETIKNAVGIKARILPVTDDPLRTEVITAEGKLSFQRYFVAKRCEPRVEAITFSGAESARLTPDVAAAFSLPDLGAIVICPSNPYLSIDPILVVPGIRSAIEASGAPVVAVSPIIGGQAIKGPTAKIMAELSIKATTRSILAHYRGLIDGLLVDHADVPQANATDPAVRTAQILMTDLDSRIELAREALVFAKQLSAR